MISDFGIRIADERRAPQKSADCENAEGNEEVGSQKRIKTKTGAQNQSVIARGRGNDEAISFDKARLWISDCGEMNTAAELSYFTRMSNPEFLVPQYA